MVVSNVYADLDRVQQHTLRAVTYLGNLLYLAVACKCETALAFHSLCVSMTLK